MELQTPYAFGRKWDAAFAYVEQQVRDELGKEGFGRLAEVAGGVRAKMERVLAAL